MKIFTQIHKKRNSLVSLFTMLLLTSFSYAQVLEVKGNNTVITNGDITPSTADFTNFGTVSIGNKLIRSFILKNTGSSSLVFPSTNIVVSSNATQFSVTTNVILKNPINNTTNGILYPNTYTIIEISFNPTTPGTKTATITINLTTGSPNPYTFTIEGNATPTVTPDFAMTQLTPTDTLKYPYALLYGPDDYLWLTEREGKKVRRVSKDGSHRDILLKLDTQVYQSGGQDGLMGMALHPNLGKGTSEDFVYIAYTYSTTPGKTGWTWASPGSDPIKLAANASDDATRRTKIIRYTYSVTSNDGSLATPMTIIEGLSSSNDHNSGKLLIGPDNKLYYTIGDLGVNQFANKCNVNRSQDIPTAAMLSSNPKNYQSYQGKTLRLNLNGSIPADNPVINGVQSHIFTYGHRNAQGLVFGKNGKLYSSEHGPKSDDELNILTSGGNYGWPFVSGYKDNKNYEFCNWSTAPTCSSIPFNDYSCGVGATSLTESSWAGTFTNPITTLFTIDAGYNFTGGWLTWPTIGPSSAKIYEGFNSQIPGWDNSIFITTLKKGRVYRQKLSADGNSVVGAAEELFYTQNRYRDIAFDPDGKTIYIITDTGGTTSGPSGQGTTTLNNKGVILKFVYQPSLVTCTAPVPDITDLPTVENCSSVTLTPPTATNPCAGTGGIVGQTTTVFPITTQGTTTVTWTYKYGNGLSVTQNQTVIISNSTTTWNGSTWSNGAPDNTKGAIIAANYTAVSNLSTCSLTVNNNATVIVNPGVNFNITGDVKVETGASLTFESNTNLFQTKNTNGNSGNITVKRKTSELKRLDFVLWSSPVTGQGLYAFSKTTLPNRFYVYNTNTNQYNSVGFTLTGLQYPSPLVSPNGINGTDTSNVPFSTAKGYLIRMPWDHPTDPTIWEGQFKGVPNNGDLSLTVDHNKLNAVGNPYPSEISANAFIDANFVTEPLYFWRKTNSVLGTTTSYASYTKLGGTANSGGSSNIVPNGTIQVGQGFIYKATSSVLTFNNAMRLSHSDDQFLRSTTSIEEKSRFWLNLSKDNEPVNQMMVGYMDGATTGIDPSIDGRYINDSQTSLNSLLENEEFVIQGKGLPFENTDIVPLAFKTETSGNFTISLDHFDGLFSGNQDVFIKDNVALTQTNLKTNSYTFTAPAGIHNSRFELVYRASASLGVEPPAFNTNSVVIYKQNEILNINAGSTIIDTVRLYSITGQLLFEQKNIDNSTFGIKDFGLTKQVILVQITSNQNKVITKKVVY